MCSNKNYQYRESQTEVVEKIVQNLEGHKSGSGYMVLCPAHADKNPSLSIKVSREGKILLHCFAGCSFHHVTDGLRALGFEFGGSHD